MKVSNQYLYMSHLRSPPLLRLFFLTSIVFPCVLSDMEDIEDIGKGELPRFEITRNVTHLR